MEKDEKYQARKSNNNSYLTKGISTNFLRDSLVKESSTAQLCLVNKIIKST